MFCLNCGKQLPENAAFCSECGTATNNTSVDNNTEPIVQSNRSVSSVSNEKEYIILSAKKAVGRGIIPLLTTAFLSLAMFMAYSIPKNITEYASTNLNLGYETRQSARELLYEFNDFFDKFGFLFIVFLILLFILDITMLITIGRTELYFTNKRLAGNTGSFFGNTTLNIPFSQILDVTVKGSWLNSGNVIVRTHNGEKFVFFIKYPYSFVQELEEETAKN